VILSFEFSCWVPGWCLGRVAKPLPSLKLLKNKVNKIKNDTLRYDAIEEFNVDSKAECDQLNLAHVA